MIEILTVQALATAATGDEVGALATLKRALALAEPNGYLRIFLDEGASLIRLLEQLRHTDAPSLRTYLARLLAAAGPSPAERVATS